ncbi:hypothetical protein HOT56_gp19 [Escherichia phage SRT7]|uniref:Uncharacterized protein n=1 Tax=Escherichia phage SRT7 TaxID=2268589 RepID=A0A2Z5H3F5_9CAUD|nr:hypothetical protein HOT56_gp19 [Escherichia phage SRT7]AXC34583.1 hypothetical protein [Escherichia phage SRT7]
MEPTIILKYVSILIFMGGLAKCLWSASWLAYKWLTEPK